VTAPVRLRVMVCDDDAATRLVITRLLTQQHACTVIACADGAQALRLLGQGTFDLLVLDVEMPVLGGLEVLEVLRDSKDHAHLPVVILSRERREDVVRHLARLGIAAYILKPVRTERALETLDRVLGSLSASGQPDFDAPTEVLEPTTTEPFESAPASPIAEISGTTGDLARLLAESAAQICGMMLDAELTPSEAPDCEMPSHSAFVDLLVQDRFSLKIGVHVPEPSAKRLAVRMLNAGTREVSDVEVTSAVKELGSLMAARVHAGLAERSVTSSCSAPYCVRHQQVVVPDILEGEGFVQWHTLGTGETLGLSLAADTTVSTPMVLELPTAPDEGPDAR